VETKRGAGDPTYLYYTLGKLEIMKLREDLKKKQGAAFSLQKFHDDFLRQGFSADHDCARSAAGGQLTGVVRGVVHGAKYYEGQVCGELGEIQEIRTI
jgi:hypothetical protein